MDDLKLRGAPGCGKTYAGLNWLIDRIEDGADLYRCAFVSYTNAAVDEANERIARAFDIDASDLPHSRTLHSLAYRALGVTGDWCIDKHLKEFEEETGFSVKAKRPSGDEEDLETVMAGAGQDAGLLQVWDFARHRLIRDVEAAYAAYAGYDVDGAARVPYGRFVAFVEAYEGYKQTHYLRDFTDLLLDLLESPVSLPASAVVIDESQDLSPLMWAVVDVLFGNAEYRAVLADPDQAIYSYSGAAPELFLRRPSREYVQLTVSHQRPSRAVVDTAREIIRHNRDHEAMEWTPAPVDGEARRIWELGEVDLLNGESWFVLVRNWKVLPQATAYLEASGIPYEVLGDRQYSPWSEKGPLQAVRTLLALSKGETVPLQSVQGLAKKTRSETKETPGLWVHGAKKKLGDLVSESPNRPASWRDLAELGMTEPGFRRLMLGDLGLLEKDLSQRDLRAYETAVERGTFGKESRVGIGTIHSAKGKESDNSVVILGCTAGPARAMLYPARVEEERRCAYVGVSRAKRNFYGCVCQPAPGLYPWELCEV